MAKVVSKVIVGPTFQDLITVDTGMGHREQLGSLLEGHLLREQSLGFYTAAGNIQGRDRGMAWMSQLPRFSPKLRKKRTQRALDTFSSS